MYWNNRDVKFDIQMRAESRRGARGIEHYNQVCGVPFFGDDPLDDFVPAPKPKRARRKQRKGELMTPEEFRDARGALGLQWGLGRPLTLTEFGRVLRLGGVRPDQSVRDYERGKTPISGPLSQLIELLLAGAKPARLDAILKP